MGPKTIYSTIMQNVVDELRQNLVDELRQNLVDGLSMWLDQIDFVADADLARSSASWLGDNFVADVIGLDVDPVYLWDT